MSHSHRFHQGVDHFNREEFFEAHDVWEEIWNDTSGADRKFYQGLIQVASALHHLKTGNMRGARMLHGSGLELLSSYGARHRGVDLDRLRADFNHSVEGLLLVPLDQLAGRGRPGLRIPYTHDLAFKINVSH